MTTEAVVHTHFHRDNNLPAQEVVLPLITTATCRARGVVQTWSHTHAVWPAGLGRRIKKQVRGFFFFIPHPSRFQWEDINPFFFFISSLTMWENIKCGSMMAWKKDEQFKVDYRWGWFAFVDGEDFPVFYVVHGRYSIRNRLPLWCRQTLFLSSLCAINNSCVVATGAVQL